MITSTNRIYDYMSDRNDIIIQNTYYLGLYETLYCSEYTSLKKHYTVLLGMLEEILNEKI